MIEEVRRVLRAEWLKMWHKRTTWLVPLVLVAFVILTVIGLDFATRRNWVGLPNGYFVASAALSWLINVIMLAVVISASFTILQEFALGTIRSSWIRPLSRRAWYTGKVLATCSAVGTLFLVAAGVTILVSLFKLGFTDLHENEYLLHSSSSLAGRLLMCVMLTLWALWAATITMTAVASLFTHPGGAIAAGLAVGVLFMALAIFPPVRPFLLSTLTTAPMDQMAAMSKGLPLPYAWGSLVSHTLIGSALWMIAALVIGDRIIARKQITS